jgi:hypothetical protein
MNLIGQVRSLATHSVSLGEAALIRGDLDYVSQNAAVAVPLYR